MPFTGNFLMHNDQTKGLLHEDDRDLMNPNRRLQPRSTYDPWEGQLDPYSHETNWYSGPWGPRSTPNRGPTWGTSPIHFPVDQPRWDPLTNAPVYPYHITAPLAVVEIYFSVSIMNKPTGTISQWLWDKLDGTPDLGLTPGKIRNAFYPTNYEHWQYRRALNLFEDTLADDINARGPPHMVRNTV